MKPTHVCDECGTAFGKEASGKMHRDLNMATGRYCKGKVVSVAKLFAAMNRHGLWPVSAISKDSFYRMAEQQVRSMPTDSGEVSYELPDGRYIARRHDGSDDCYELIDMRHIEQSEADDAEGKR